QAEELARQAVSDKEALTALYRRQRELDAALTGLRDRLQDGERVLKEKEAEAREAKQRLERAVQEAGDLEMEYREIGVHMDHLRQGMQARHACDLDQAMPAFQRLEASEVEALTQALDKNRQVVENFGEVNLLALNEHAELKERHEFLAAQAADLQASLDTLQATITRINRVSRQRFSETFTTVNERFEEVFGKIFPGGKGRLSLTDESDLLETGVDIHLQIPGKRTQNVTLLSGGEKSLAAIALIFAILLYRPTPFLVLDEVDAALDDANIALFNRLVREIAEHSQVLMITHNKRTMEVAENLYGVTMAKQGVSSLVSVSLQQS
ncbi:MAG TPA: AAA family ATPase, partial [Syntrophales bacterium]|nr:AAA family ATPase [Syntrophales bacterium]